LRLANQFWLNFSIPNHQKKQLQFINRCVPGVNIPSTLSAVEQADNPLQEGILAAEQSPDCSSNLPEAFTLGGVKQKT